MAIERTLSIVKRCGRQAGDRRIFSRFEENGLRIIGAKMKHFSRAARPKGFMRCTRAPMFLDGLVAFMCSGPVMIQVLEGETPWRKTVS